MVDCVVLRGRKTLDIVKEEDEDEFCSCCGDEEVLKDSEELVKVDLNEELDEYSVKLYSKGLSIIGSKDSDSGFSGIGVVMKRSDSLPAIRVQKRLEFYVDEMVANYLALMEGLLVAGHNNIRRVFAFTDSQLLYDQITSEEKLDMPLINALRERITGRANKLETFAIKLAPVVDLEQPFQLAQVAIGVVSFPVRGKQIVENCSICCEDKSSAMMVNLKCHHKFCSHCMRTYVDGKIHSSQLPIQCPEPRCKYYICTSECRSFLPFTSFESLEKAHAEANVNSDKIYCPFPSCSVPLDPRECLCARASSSSHSQNTCIECPVCLRFICVDCGVPWHSAMSCEEYQNLSLDERNAADITSHCLAQNNQNKRRMCCQYCLLVIECTQGCYRMTCRCGHEFCYSCGVEYRHGQQACQCVYWEEEYSEDSGSTSIQETEQWAWETFDSLPMVTDAYSKQERSQLALIQRFLAGGFSLSDHNQCQSPPRCTDSYVDTMKDLHQLPWLERFVSVISDIYYEDYMA